MKNAASGIGERKANKLFNFRPALFAAFFLVLGVGFAYCRIARGVSFWWLLALCPLLVLPLVFSEGLSNFLLRLAVVLLLFAIFCLGFLCFRRQVTSFQNATYYTGATTVVGEVESVKRVEESATLTLKRISIGGEKAEGRIRAYLPTYVVKDVGVGDKVIVEGEIGTDLSLTAQYGFRATDIGKRVYYTLTAEESCIRVEKSKDPFLFVRARLEEVLYTGMEETPAALTLALLTGDVTGVDGELMDNMRYGGISHIFAVSGLNVGALFLCCLFLFRKTPMRKLPKPARFFLLATILFFYSGVCGFSASVVRAAITCAVCYLAALVGTGKDMLNALGIAAIIILLISPSELLGVGFQLSFLACLGLFLLTKPTTQVFDEIRKAYRKSFPRKYTAEEEKALLEGNTLPPTVGERVWSWTTGVLSASIAAQIATIPALLYHFGYLSGWTLLLNFLFVPVTDALFTLLLIGGAACCILPTAFSTVLLYIPSLLWSAATLLFETADFSSFGVGNVQISLAICVCYYGGMIFLTDKLNIPKGVSRALSLVCWVFFAVSLHLYNL